MFLVLSCNIIDAKSTSGGDVQVPISSPSIQDVSEQALAATKDDAIVDILSKIRAWQEDDFSHQTDGHPKSFVTLTYAQSLDGSVAVIDSVTGETSSNVPLSGKSSLRLTHDQLLKAFVLKYLVLFASLLLGKAAAHFEKISFQILAHLGCQLMVWRRFGFGRLRWRLFRLLLGGHGISGSSGAIFQKELSFGALRNTISVIVLELPRAETEVLNIYFCLDAHPLHALHNCFSASLAPCPAGGREFETISDASALLGRHRRVGALPTARGAHGCY